MPDVCTTVTVNGGGGGGDPGNGGGSPGNGGGGSSDPREGDTGANTGLLLVAGLGAAAIFLGGDE